MITAAVHGFLLALGLILPLGAQNLFVLTQGAIQPKFVRVIPVIITASLCDTFLILIAVLGISAVVLTFSWVKLLLVGVGVLFLGYIGWMTWKSDTPAPSVASTDDQCDVQNVLNDTQSGLTQNPWPITRLILFSMSVSLLNPHAILDTIGVIGTSSIQYQPSEKIGFVLACIFVSWLWFFILAIAGRWVGSFPQIRRALNKVSALIMWGSAIYLIYTVLLASRLAS
ncbi:LysE family transporter [Candidatus Acetothermia bacterium]|nr:LysE family transporter [Candidatus Acetothermia bacterium]MBI3643285.1 LysE family transporter [Candidatus Acetothermia bacterium]